MLSCHKLSTISSSFVILTSVVHHHLKRSHEFMKITLIMIITSILSLLTGCGLIQNVTSAVPLAKSSQFRTISPTKVHTEDIPIPATNRIFKTQQEVDDFLASVPFTKGDERGNPVPATLPSIDFSTEIGILVTFGPQNSSGYLGTISAVEEKADKLIVHPLLQTPTGITLGVVTYPYHYIAIPQTSKVIEFAPTVTRQQPPPWWSIL